MSEQKDVFEINGLSVKPIEQMSMLASVDLEMSEHRSKE
jgi:hypothetical protein